MHEHIPMPASARLDLIRYQAYSVALQFCNGCRQIRNAETNMVQPLAVLGDELSNGRIVRSRFQQFQAALAHRHHHQPNFFLLNGFFWRNAQSQLLVNGLRRRQRLHCDTKMINGDHASPLSTPSGRDALATAEPRKEYCPLRMDVRKRVESG